MSRLSPNFCSTSHRKGLNILSPTNYTHMNDNGYSSSEQLGFLRLHSTVTSLVKSTDDWYNGTDLGKLIGVVFIDIKKVFDTIDYDILCHKLEYYGIQGRDLVWFKSYLSSCKQFTRVDGVDSSIQEMKSGVPQDSYLDLFYFLFVSMIYRGLSKFKDVHFC